MYERPGRSFYTIATKAVKHLDPITEHGMVGTAIKITAKSWAAGLDANYARIEVGEKVNIRTKGIHQHRTEAGSPGVAIAAAVPGDGIYIRPADNTLILEANNAAGDLPYGRVVEVVAHNPGRGVPANKIRIDLDQKDTLPVAA